MKYQKARCDYRVKKIDNNKIWIHSAKKYCEIVDKLPDNAVFWKESTWSVPVGIVAKEERKKGTVFHVHKVNGSSTYTGSHLVYIIRKERKTK